MHPRRGVLRQGEMKTQGGGSFPVPSGGKVRFLHGGWNTMQGEPGDSTSEKSLPAFLERKREQSKGTVGNRTTSQG